MRARRRPSTRDTCGMPRESPNRPGPAGGYVDEVADRCRGAGADTSPSPSLASAIDVQRDPFSSSMGDEELGQSWVNLE